MTRIVTDGAADLPGDDARHVAVVSGPVRIGHEVWDGDLARFWAELGKRSELPATEAPSVDQLAAAYAGADPVLAVHVSERLSRTVEHARLASAAAGTTVRVVDTRSLSVGTGLVALAAAEAASAGVQTARLVELAEGWVDRLHLHAVIDDAQFLVHGGRGGLVAARVGRHAHRHVLAVKGHMIPIQQVRHRSEAIRELIDHVREHAAGGVSTWAVGHGDAADVGEFVERLTSVFGTDASYVTLLGAPVGAHMGPGALVVGFFSDS